MKSGSYRNICQRPTASKALRMCSIRGSLTVIRPDDRHDVEPAALLEHPVHPEEVRRGERQPSLLLGRHGLRRYALATRLDLDEDQDLALARDQVDLAEPVAMAASQDAQALPAQVTGGRALTPVAQQPIPECPDFRCHRGPIVSPSS